ncbi:MAG: anthranilate synthase component I [Phycisphaeraceae bacterium]|nr:MAG: anthranilate synthase component I [Phycisphaeraceae bacterium]
MANLDRDSFISLLASERAAAPGRLAVPLGVRLLADQLTPVLAYRRLVAPDERTAPSFLLESVENGDRVGRHSILGSRPVMEVVARGNEVTTTDRRSGCDETRTQTCDDPADTLRDLTASIRLARPTESVDRGLLPDCLWGGWVGYASYDTARYAEPEKLDPANAPPDDRGLPELHFGFYDGVIVFDHVERLVHVVQLCIVDEEKDAGEAYDRAVEKLRGRVDEIQRHSKPLPAGLVGAAPTGEHAPMPSNITRERHAEMVAQAKEYIAAGDIFQVVVGQRFERKSAVDPFDVYRALRAVNPSPYMVYMQAGACILIASSPEILCRVERTEANRFLVTNRPLAGTRRRGRTPEEDRALEVELLADQKERAEHIMLVDLGRNDVGRVCEPGTIALSKVMTVERYSHVMHISSTVTGELRAGLDCWDALRAALPVGTISGAPKIRAMQIIDELEPVRRGPYGGGMGAIGLDGQMDIALALRTMVVPVATHRPGDGDGIWTYHIQAAGGIVADSRADDEYMETVNKAAALGRAIDLAEDAFGDERH